MNGCTGAILIFIQNTLNAALEEETCSYFKGLSPKAASGRTDDIF